MPAPFVAPFVDPARFSFMCKMFPFAGMSGFGIPFAGGMPASGPRLPDGRGPPFAGWTGTGPPFAGCRTGGAPAILPDCPARRKELPCAENPSVAEGWWCVVPPLLIERGPPLGEKTGASTTGEKTGAVLKNLASGVPLAPLPLEEGVGGRLWKTSCCCVGGGSAGAAVGGEEVDLPFLLNRE